MESGSALRGHYIVCGLGIVGYRAVELLHRLGERVVVVTLSGHDDRIQGARAAGVEVEIADARDPNVALTSLSLPRPALRGHVVGHDPRFFERDPHRIAESLRRVSLCKKDRIPREIPH